MSKLSERSQGNFIEFYENPRESNKNHSGLPSPKFPTVNRVDFVQLISSTILISLVAFMESVSVAKILAAKHKRSLVCPIILHLIAIWFDLIFDPNSFDSERIRNSLHLELQISSDLVSAAIPLLEPSEEPLSMKMLAHALRVCLIHIYYRNETSDIMNSVRSDQCIRNHNDSSFPYSSLLLSSKCSSCLNQ